MSDKFFPSNSWFWRGLTYFWTAPNSLLGLTVGVIGLCFGGGVSVHRGCLEFHGGLSKLILSRLGVVGMTLGHTILGQTKLDLEQVRDHEQVHVRQYEILGPLFIPAYLGCSVWLWFRGRDPYRDNPFETQAYDLSDPRVKKNKSQLPSQEDGSQHHKN